MSTKLYQKNLFMTLVLICAIGFSIWLLQSPFFKTNETQISQSTTPDAFMTQVEYLNYELDGQWGTRIQADHVVHYPKKDFSKLENPHLVSRSEGLSWVVSAKYGTAEDGLETVYLTDQVSVDRFEGLQNKTLSLKTSTLTIWPNRKLARTDQAVTIIQPNSTIDAVGLTADLNTGDIHLLSSVKGSYTPPPSP